MTTTLLEDNLLTYKPYNVTSDVVSTRAFSSADETCQNNTTVSFSEMSVARLVEKPKAGVDNQKYCYSGKYYSKVPTW